jgi:hypothetical protein
MGHSFGGSVVEILLDRRVGAVGVAIDPGPIKGVLKLPVSELKSASPGLRNPKNRHRAVMLTPEEFHYAFTNSLTNEESAARYERYAIPGPGKALFQAAFANFHPHSPTKVDFHSDDRAPLLLIASEHHHTAPVAVTRSEYRLETKIQGDHGVQGVRRPVALHDWPARLGSRRRLRARLGPQPNGDRRSPLSESGAWLGSPKRRANRRLCHEERSRGPPPRPRSERPR